MPDSFKFRAMTYNLHLFGDSSGLIDLVDFASIFGIGDPLTFYDDQRLTEIIRAIRAESPRPDVIGLTEVWDKRFAALLVEKLRDLYPYFAIGSYVPSSDGAITFALPDFDILGAGLLLMSKHPFDGEPVFYPYMSEAGFDAWAEKGVLAAKIQVPDINATVGVLLTHLQANSDEADVRRDQLGELAAVDAVLRLSSPRMALLAMGDFNVIGEDGNGQQTNEYQSMIEQLGLTDTWRDQHPNDPGVTYAGGINDLSKQFDEDDTSQERLDYLFYDPNPSYYVDCEPTLCKLLKYQSEEGIGSENVRDLSDHYGLLAEYRVEVRPIGTTTYQIDTDSYPSVDIETPALRSLLAWMEHVAIGYAPAKVGKEAPLLRIGFVDSNLFEGGVPAIERLGAVWLNPAPLIAGQTWSWGQGYDPASYQLDLAYTLQHFVGRALHSLSPNSSDVNKILAEQNSVPESVMLPYDPARQLVDSANQPDPDHSRHLKQSDTDYITALYTARPSPIEWKDRAAALADNAIIKKILESGITGTDTNLSQNIVSIRREIERLGDEIVQAQTPIAVDVYIDRLRWYGPVEDWGCNESGEHRFTATLTSSDPKNEEQPRTSSKTYPGVCGYVSIDPPADFSPNWGKPFVSIPSVLGIVDFYLVVVQVDSFLNGDNESTSSRYRVSNVEGIINRIRHPQGPDIQTVCKRIGDGSNWYADIRFVFRAHAGSRSRVAAKRAPLIETKKALEADLRVKETTRERLRTETPGDLARFVGERLVSVMERS